MKRIVIIILNLLSITTYSQTDSVALYSETAISLKTATGVLHGTICLPPSGKSFPLALIISGSGPTDRNGNGPMTKNNSLLQLAHELAKAGIASVRYDKRGIAASMAAGRDESEARFEDMSSDASAWMDTLKKDSRFSSITIIGHSEGSLVGMLASGKADRFISLAGPGEPAGQTIKRQLEAQPAFVRNEAIPKIDSLEKGLTVQSVPPYLLTLLRPSVQPYLMSWFKYDPSAEIAKLRIPTLIIQGTTDIQVSAEDARKLSAAQPKAKLVLIDQMNHVLKQSAEYRPDNLKTYNDPSLPLHVQLAPGIISFIRQR